MRLVGQGRADAIVENIDFFMAFTENYPDVELARRRDPIFVAYCAIGVSQGNDNLTEVLNIILYDLHSSGMVNETWEKFYGAPMLRTVDADPLLLILTPVPPGPPRPGRLMPEPGWNYTFQYGVVWDELRCAARRARG